jgi:hypothetical protein
MMLMGNFWLKFNANLVNNDCKKTLLLKLNYKVKKLASRLEELLGLPRVSASV